MSVYSPSFVAGGDISPARFVKIDTTASEPFQVVNAGANGKAFGISQEGSRRAPGLSITDSDLAAKDTEGLKVFGPGEICLLQLTGSITQGDYIKSDTNGTGIVALTTGTVVQNIGAIALEDGLTGEKIRVKVWPVPFLPAVS